MHESFFFFLIFRSPPNSTLLSLHDALPIFLRRSLRRSVKKRWPRSDASWPAAIMSSGQDASDRKSTRLNSSHGYISYAVFCLKKKNYYHRRLTSRLGRRAFTYRYPTLDRLL